MSADAPPGACPTCDGYGVLDGLEPCPARCFRGRTFEVLAALYAARDSLPLVADVAAYIASRVPCPCDPPCGCAGDARVQGSLHCTGCAHRRPDERVDDATAAALAALAEPIGHHRAAALAVLDESPEPLAIDPAPTARILAIIGQAACPCLDGDPFTCSITHTPGAAP